MMNYELLIANRELLIDYATILHFPRSLALPGNTLRYAQFCSLLLKPLNVSLSAVRAAN